MMISEFDSMVKNEQYKDMIRQAERSARAEDGAPRTRNSIAKTVLLSPIFLISLTVRVLLFWTHMGNRS